MFMFRFAAALVIFAVAVAVSVPLVGQAPAPAPLTLPQETHLANVRQLTFGGENAEAYFSFDGKRLSFQSSASHGCDQIYTMTIDGGDKRLVSSGQGRTTCSHYRNWPTSSWSMRPKHVNGTGPYPIS